MLFRSFRKDPDVAAKTAEYVAEFATPYKAAERGYIDMVIEPKATAMGKKYLGEHFDIHGGGMDLIFPHHECEIAHKPQIAGRTAPRRAFRPGTPLQHRPTLQNPDHRAGPDRLRQNVYPRFRRLQGGFLRISGSPLPNAQKR